MRRLDHRTSAADRAWDNLEEAVRSWDHASWAVPRVARVRHKLEVGLGVDRAVGQLLHEGASPQGAYEGKLCVLARRLEPVKRPV